MHSVNEIADVLSMHMGMEVKSIAKDHRAIKDELCTNLLCWKHQPMSMEKEDIMLFASLAKFLKDFRNQLGNNVIWEDLTSAIVSLELDIEGRVVELIKDCCANMKQSIPEIHGNFHMQLEKICFAVKTFGILNKVQFKEIEFDIMYGEGISKVREIIDLGVDLNILKKSGSWFSYGETKLGQGRDAIKALILDNPELMEELEAKIKNALVTPTGQTEVLQD
jgi:hypothetical protein